MNYRKILLNYLEKNNDFTINSNIYENYSEKEEIKILDYFIEDYLNYIIESFKNVKRDRQKSSIQAVIDFFELTSVEKIYKEKFNKLQDLLSILLDHINLSIRNNNSKNDKIIYSSPHSLHLLNSLADTINCFFIMFPKGNVKIHERKHLLRILVLIQKKIQEYENSSYTVLHRNRTSFENTSFCIKNLKEIIRNPDKFIISDFDINTGFESEYLKQLLLILTRNYQATLNSTLLLLNITSQKYMAQFINSIIFELKENKDSEITFNYCNSIRNFYSRTIFRYKRTVLLKSTNSDSSSRNNSIKRLHKKQREKEISKDKWYNLPQNDVLKHELNRPFCQHQFFETIIGLKELFLTLGFNYEGTFSKSTLFILEKIQTCQFWELHNLISLILDFREREYIRQTFELIITYLDNNNCVDLDALWIVNVSLENSSKTNVLQHVRNSYQPKPSCNLFITLGFSGEVENIEENNLLEVLETPFYIPINYREEMFENDFEFIEVESKSILSI